MDFLWFLLIGAVSGWLAGQVWKGAGFGLVGNILVGIAGGIVGGWVSRQLQIGGGGLLWQIIVAAAGAWLILFIISQIKKV